MRSTSRALSIVLVLSLSALFAGAAYGAPPYSQPKQVFATGFENGQPNAVVAPSVVEGENTSAYWGRSTAVFRSGPTGLWCAGTDVASGGPGSFWPTYPTRTRGLADLELPALADYFSSSFSFWYLMPTVGSEDRLTLTVGRHGGSAEPPFVQGEELAVVSGWTQRVIELGPGGVQAASRQPLIARFAFFDDVESAPAGELGQGPTIDDIVVTGYRYGPVRNLAAAWSEGVGVTLAWRPPAESAVSAADDSRPMVYRVWRSLRGADQWTELTVDAPVSDTTLIDDSAQPVLIYDYVVQAWDTGGVTHHGVQSLPVSIATPGAPEPPVASVDSYQVDHGSVLSVPAPGVLGNDSSQGPMNAVVVDPPSRGTVVLVADGSFRYTPDADWSGTDTFSYRAVTQSVYSAPATVTVVVRPRPEPPAPSASTVVVASVSRTLATYGSPYDVTGRLESAGKPLAGRTVVLEAAGSSSGPFVATGIEAVTAADGSYSLRHLPRSTTHYRVRFAGQPGAFLEATSAIRSAIPRAFVRTPVAPRSMRAGRASTVYGYLKPRHTAGSYPVRIYRYRSVGGKWKSYGYVKAKASSYSSYTKYTAKVKLPYRGRWRLRAYHPADSAHAASWSSGFDYVTVR